MTTPRCFISFDFDNDENEKHLFAGQAKNSRTPFEIQDWSSKTSLPQNEWERQIREKISRCNALIVLVGKNMHYAAGVAKEIRFAQELNVPFFGIYVGGANESNHLPTGLIRNRVINWSWDLIASAIQQVMKEGKNR